MTTRWQEQDFLTFGLCCLHHRLELCNRGGITNSHFVCEIYNGWYKSCPDDVFNVNIITNQVFLIGIYINDSYQTFLILSEVIYSLPETEIVVSSPAKTKAPMS